VPSPSHCTSIVLYVPSTHPVPGTSSVYSLYVLSVKPVPSDQAQSVPRTQQPGPPPSPPNAGTLSCSRAPIFLDVRRRNHIQQLTLVATDRFMQPCLLLSTKSTKIDSSDSSDYSSQHHSGLIALASELLFPTSLWTNRPTITLDCSSYCSSHSSGLIVPIPTTVRTTTRSYPPWIIGGYASANPGADIALLFTTVPAIHESVILGEELLSVSNCNLLTTILQFLLYCVLQFCVQQFLQFLASCNPANLQSPPLLAHQSTPPPLASQSIPTLPYTFLAVHTHGPSPPRPYKGPHHMPTKALTTSLRRPAPTSLRRPAPTSLRRPAPNTHPIYTHP
jgi:hypothetical protein